MISDILRLAANVLAGPTDAAEDCKTVQNIIACTEKKEEDVSQGKVLWEGMKTREKVIGTMKDCMSSLMGGK